MTVKRLQIVESICSTLLFRKDVVNLNQRISSKPQSTFRALTFVPFKESGDSTWQFRVFALSGTPVDDITIKKTPISLYLYIARDWGCSMERKVLSILRREGQSVPNAVPVFV